MQLQKHGIENKCTFTCLLSSCSIEHNWKLLNQKNRTEIYIISWYLNYILFQQNLYFDIIRKNCLSNLYPKQGHEFILSLNFTFEVHERLLLKLQNHWKLKWKVVERLLKIKISTEFTLKCVCERNIDWGERRERERERRQS